jgi:predicted TIM-barrel fold metal-dependent hydrolase
MKGTMLRIDAHSHLGTCRVFDSDQPASVLLEAMDRHGIDASIVQPFPGAPDARAVHDDIARLGQEYPGRFYGMASVSPHQVAEDYRSEIRRCVQELGFVGVKAHALGHAINPRSRDARLVFDTAAELGIPVMVHTGHGVPFAEPTMWIPLARDFPDSTVILAHAGAPGYTGVAVIAAEVCPNIVLETSWVSPHDLGRAVRALGADRVLFGSDLHFNPGHELAKYQALGLPDVDLEKCLGGNAVRIFGLSRAAVGV